jgi:mono/diheme cytochrome c family protein
MSKISHWWVGLAAALVASVGSADEASIERGEYLAAILGCGGCHTQGALLGEQTGAWLAGSTIGIAYTDAAGAESPGIVFAGNLTPDEETGLGRWSRQDIVRMIQSGINHEEVMVLPVMPWPNYGRLRKEDLNAIADYLMSLPPVKNEVPDNSAPGEAAHSYVRIGVYLFDADGNLAERFGRPPEPR